MSTCIRCGYRALSETEQGKSKGFAQFSKVCCLMDQYHIQSSLNSSPYCLRRSSRSSCNLLLCCYLQVPTSVIHSHSLLASLALVSIHLLDLQGLQYFTDLSSTQDLHFLLSRHPSSYQRCLLFWGSTSLQHPLFFLNPLAPGFLNQNSQSAGPHSLISLLSQFSC